MFISYRVMIDFLHVIFKFYAPSLRDNPFLYLHSFVVVSEMIS